MQSLLSDEQVAEVPVLVLGNKIDKEGAVSEEHLRLTLKLHAMTTGKVFKYTCTSPTLKNTSMCTF